MLDIIADIRKALENNCLCSALGLALTLPDICGQIEYPDFKKEKGEKKSLSQIRYETWCNNYLFNQGFLPDLKVDYSKDSNDWERIRCITGDMCYKLRCSYLHSGNTELNQRENDTFPVFELRMCSKEDNGIYVEPTGTGFDGKERFVLDVRHLCHVLCNAAKEYYNQHEPESDFDSHNIKIVDVETGAKKSIEWKRLLNERLAAKTDIKNYDELTDSAKKLFENLKSGNIPEPFEKLPDEEEVILLADFGELVQGEFINIPEGGLHNANHNKRNHI